MIINALVLTLALAVPQQAMSPAQQKANDAFVAQKWSEAAAAYEALTKEMPNAPQPQFRLAASLVSLGKYEDAIPHFQQAEKLGSPTPQVALRLAQTYAALGRSDDAFVQLKRATDAGLGILPPPLDTDPSLAKLKSDPRFKTFETAMDRNVRPCEYDPHFRELDYWIGEWDVRGVNRHPIAAKQERDHQGSQRLRDPRNLHCARLCRPELQYLRSIQGSVAPDVGRYHRRPARILGRAEGRQHHL